MKMQNRRRAAFFSLRLLIASLLCLTAGMLALFAFANSNTPQNSSTRWLTRLASSVGVSSSSARAGAVKLDKFPAEKPTVTAETATAIPYSGPPVGGPVKAVRSGKLRDMPPIDPDTVEKHWHLEPVLPNHPTQNGGEEGPIQQSVDALQATAPSPTGVNFDGVGEGLAGFHPSSNPPDVNGSVGATQYFQWNNTSFAIFNKATGALEY
jgi:hypothetical protein